MSDLCSLSVRTPFFAEKTCRFNESEAIEKAASSSWVAIGRTGFCRDRRRVLLVQRSLVSKASAPENAMSLMSKVSAPENAIRH